MMSPLQKKRGNKNMNDSTVLTPVNTNDQPGECCALPDGLEMDQAEAARLASMLKAVGHPVRLQIVDLLIRYRGQVCVCDVESLFNLSQPTISHHLKVLRKTGLVESERRGSWHYYFVAPSALRELRQWFDSMLED